EDGIRDDLVTGVQTCALPICGERLTRQLLAFSRRQMLRPEPIDLRHRVQDISDMLSPSLRADIEVIVKIPDQLWLVSLDLAEFRSEERRVGKEWSAW